MRLKFFAAVSVMAAVAFLFSAPGALSQGKKKGKGGFFPGGGPGGGPGSFRMTMPDPSAMFDMFAKGRPYFLISEMPWGAQQLTEFASAKGVADGKITRELYTDYMKARMGNFGNLGKGPPPADAGNNQGAVNFDQMAEMEFNRRDQNQDGFLNVDEMPGNLRDDLTRWDRNRDGLIDLSEYKTYFAARMQERMERAKAATGGTIIIEEDWDKRPVVYRAGKLPPGLPKWFTELDRDGDGQVSLAEWRRGNRDLEEFAQYDLNDDGLLTAAEVLRVETVARNGKADRENRDGSVVDSMIQGERQPWMGKGNFGPGGFGGKKKKNWGGGN